MNQEVNLETEIKFRNFISDAFPEKLKAIVSATKEDG